nr:MAG TPA: Sigma-70, region 4 [Caudoviricetes sp.]
MNREQLNKYKKNKREIERLKEVIEKLQERIDDIPVVSGKVTKSSDEFPYIEQHIQVEMKKPEVLTPLKRRIREKEKKKDELTKQNEDVEKYIENIPEGIAKSIFEMVYLDGMTQNEVAEYLGYTKGRISQIITETVKD